MVASALQTLEDDEDSGSEDGEETLTEEAKPIKKAMGFGDYMRLSRRKDSDEMDVDEE